MWISSTLGGVLLAPGNVCMYRRFNTDTTKHIDAALSLRIWRMKCLQSYRVKRKQVATDFYQLSRPPSHPNKKNIQQALFHKSTAFKKIIDIWSSWWTKQVFIAHPKPLDIYQSINNQSGSTRHQPFSCHFLPQHLPVHWGHLLNLFLWHQQCPRWLSPVNRSD